MSEARRRILCRRVTRFDDHDGAVNVIHSLRSVTHSVSDSQCEFIVNTKYVHTALTLSAGSSFGLG